MFNKLFRFLMGQRTHTASSRRNRKPRRYQPSFEMLEDRAVPANNLSVNQFGTLLLIVDDDLSQAGTNNQQATLTYNAGQLTVTGNGGTQLNNGVVPLSFLNIRDIIVEAGRGNDLIQTNGITLAGSLTFVGREANDVLTMTGDNSIGGDIVFLAGDGNNQFFLRSGANRVAGVIDVVNGNGVHEVAIANGLATDSATVGALFVHNGVNTTGTGNALTLGGGVGTRFTSSGPVVYVERGATTANSNVALNTTGTSSIGGDVFVDTAAGNDVVNVINFNIRGHLIDLGNAGNDVLLLQVNNLVQGNVVFIGADGNNTFFLTGTATVSGVVDIVNGNGRHAVQIADGAATNTAVVGALFVHNGINTTGTGNNLTIGGGTGARFTSSGSVVYVEDGATTANSNVALNTTGTSSIGGDLFVATAAGNDSVTVSNLTVRGHVIDLANNGNDTLSFPGNNVIQGNISFNGGDGNNTFNMFGGADTVFGIVDIVNGSGSQKVQIADSSGDRAVVGGLFVNNGINNTGTGNLLDIGHLGAGTSFTSFGSVVYQEHPLGNANTVVFVDATETAYIGGDLIVATAGGNDDLDIRNTSIRGSLLHFPSLGNDRLFLLLNNVIQGNVFFDGGDGNNTFSQNGSDLTVYGLMEIHNGNGFQNVSLGTSANNHVTVFRGLFIHNGPNTTGTASNVGIGAGGAGTQFVRIEGPMVYVDFGAHTAATNFFFNGPTTLSSFFDVFTGGGGDSFNFSSTLTIQDRLFIATGDSGDSIGLNPAAALTVNGPVIVLSGSGNDVVVLGGTFGSSVFIDAGLDNDNINIGSDFAGANAIATTIQGPVTIFLGDGVNTLRVNDTTFSSSVAFFGGAGVDTVLVEKIDSGSRTFFNGPLTGILGASDDTVDVGRNADADDGAAFNSFVFLDGDVGVLDHLFVGSNLLGGGAIRPGNTVANFALVTIVGFEDLATP